MIKYNKLIKIDRKRNGDIRIESDRGDLYETATYSNSRTLLSNWWKDQHQSELREWQKELVIKYAGDSFGQLELFNIYKKGQGYSQPHDMCLCHSVAHKVWVFATETDYWIQLTDGGNIVFDKQESVGSVLDKDTRLVIGTIWDNIKQQFNPNNLCNWVKY